MKINRIFIFVLFMVILLALTPGCSSVSGTTTITQPFQIPDNFTTYTDENSLFSIAYPNQWEPLSQSELTSLYAQVKDAINSIKSGEDVDKASMIFMAGKKTGNGYYPYAGIVVEPAPSVVFTNGLAVQAAVKGIKQLASSYQEISRIKTMVNGKDAAILEYTAQFTSTTLLMHNVVLICLSGKTIWSVSCSATDTDYNHFSSDYNIVLRSFQIKN